MAQYSRRGGFPSPKPKSWFLNEGRISAAGTLAADAQEVVIDAALEHPGTNEDYGPGALEGLRLTVQGEPGNTTMLTAPTMVVLLLKVGAAVPTVNTAATLKQAEDQVFLMGKAELAAQGSMAAGTVRPSWIYQANPRTSRRFERGDRLVVVVVNRDGGTWSNPHTYAWSIEGYAVG